MRHDGCWYEFCSWFTMAALTSNDTDPNVQRAWIDKRLFVSYNRPLKETDIPSTGQSRRKHPPSLA